MSPAVREASPLRLPLNAVVCDEEKTWPSNPPTAEDWDRLREIIINLYSNEELPLKQVASIMSSVYQFNASESMFKKRFDKWGVGKYLTERDLSALLVALRSPGGVSELSWPPEQQSSLLRRAERRLSDAKRKSNNAAEYDEPLALVRLARQPIDTQQARPNTKMTPVVALLPPHITEYDQSKNVEVTLRGVSYYLSSYFDSRAGRRYFTRADTNPNRPANAGPSMYGRPFARAIHPAELTQNYTRAMQLLKQDHFSPGLRLLRDASTVLQKLFLDEHPALISCLLNTFAAQAAEALCLTSQDIKCTQQATFNFITRTASEALSETHPITRLCAFLQTVCTTEAVISIWQEYSRIFAMRLQPSHRLTIYVNQNFFEMLFEHERYDEAEALIRERLRPVFDHAFEATAPARLCYLRREARLLCRQGRLAQAYQSLRTTLNLMLHVLPTEQIPIRGSAFFEEMFRLALTIALYQDAVGNDEASTSARVFATDVCIAVRGPYDGKTSTMISSLEEHLLQRHEFDRLNEFRERNPAVYGGDLLPAGHCLLCSISGSSADPDIRYQDQEMPGKSAEVDARQAGLFLYQLQLLL